MIKLLGYQQVELVGHSLYQFVHVADLGQLEQAHKQLLDKGQVVSRYYRLMRRDGGYIWMQMFATLVNNPRSMPKPQHVVGICYVIGADQFDDSRSIILNEQQQMKSRSGILGSGLDKKLKLPNNSCSQLLKPSLQINMDDSSLPQSRQVDKHTNKRLRRLVVQQEQPDMIGLRGGESIQTSFQDKQQAIVDVQCRQHQASPIYSENNPFEKCTTIGSIRRPSDDACSVVSSIASASVSTSSGYSSSNLSLLSSCPHSSSSSSTSSSSCSSSVSCSESIMSMPPFSYTPKANASTTFQYYNQAQTPIATSQYQQQQISSAMEEGVNRPGVTWIMPTVHYTNYSSSIDDPSDQAKLIARSVGDVNHSSYDLHDSSWKANATSPTTTIVSSISSNIATNPGSEESPLMVGPILSSPERTYFNDQHYHRLDEHPIEDGYYNDCAIPIYLDSKCIRAMPYTDADNSHPHSYQLQYTSSQGTACLSGSAYL